jgi:hypothetical protein
MRSRNVQITTITFRRKVNTGQYESFDVEATVAVADGERPDGPAAYLQSFVDEVCLERIERLRRPGARGGTEAPEFPEL